MAADLIITDLGSLNFHNDWNPGFQSQECYIQKFLTTDPIRWQYTVLKDAILAFRLMNTTTGEPVAVAPVKVSEIDEYATYDIVQAGLGAGRYLFEIINGADVVAESIFEVCDEIENSVLIQFTNYRNDQGTVFPQGDYFAFRVEGIFLRQEMTHLAESNDFRDQNYDLHLLSASPYKKETLTVGGKSGVPEWVADKLNRIFSCTDVYIDGKPYVRSEGAAPAVTVLNPGSPLFVYKIELESSESGALSLDLQSNIGITATVVDMLTAAPASGVNVSVYLGGTQIADIQTGTNGIARKRWVVSQQEYDDIKGADDEIEWRMSKPGYKPVVRRSPAPSYYNARQFGITASTGILNYQSIVSPSGLTFAALGGESALQIIPVEGVEISVGKSGDWFEFEYSDNTVTVTSPRNPSTTQRSGSINIYDGEILALSVPIAQTGEPYVVWNGSSSTAFAFGNESPVSIREVGINSNSNWRIELDVDWFTVSPQIGSGDGILTGQAPRNETGKIRTAYVRVIPFDGENIGKTIQVGALQLMSPSTRNLTQITPGTNIRGMTIEFTNTDKRVPPVVPPEGYGLLTGSVEESTWGIGYLNYGGILIAAAGEDGDFDPIFIDNIAEGGEYDQVWLKTVVTVPDDKDYIVVQNNLPAHEGDDWGFDYATIT